jgi:hypothetical protein
MHCIERIIGLVSKLLLLTVVTMVAACASSGPPGPKSAAGAPMVGQEASGPGTATSRHCYSLVEVAAIETMREQGETLAEVVNVVGGSRADVLDLEQRFRVARRSVRRGSPALTCGYPLVTLGR